ncbi:hypothetical protein P3T36_005346 [Kitasatospora sp. MAP12-15]|uniref:hypothetical protein n=1 Tax=unclassified Kitasatospora TaxID=2633591 RepID=UPI00247620FF|nr:hypothetical protein [Kitasatospora sp. MAP12-44]MDH6109853.1 hypothetical protein [Kitasatospora sp. MAP12-44]
MVTAAEYPLALSVEFLAELSAWTWIDSTPEGLVAFLLIAHPRGAAAELEVIARSLGLATPDRAMPELAPALRCADDDGVVLVIPASDVDLRMPTAREWIAFVAAGAPVVVLISGTPLARDADLSTVSGHLLAALLPGHVWMGKTRVR